MKTTSRAKTIIKRVLLTVLTLVLALGGLAYTFQSKFKSSIPAPNFAVPRNSTEANQQDLAYFGRVFQGADHSFSEEQWGEFRHEIAALQSNAHLLSRGQLAMGVAHAAALSNNGHTGLRAGRLNHVPVRFWWFADGLYILQADPLNSDLLAARIVKIQGHASEEIVERLRPYITGNDGHKRNRSVHFMDSPEAMQALGIGDSNTSVTLELEMPDGKSFTRNLNAGPVEPQAESDARFPHAPGCDVTCNWPHVPGNQSGPMYTQQAQHGYFRKRLDNLNALYVRLFVIEDSGDMPIANFLSDTLADARIHAPANLIVDLRGNDGGNYFTVRSFTKEILKLVSGQVFIITDSGTFSAAVVTAAYLKHYAGTRIHIVGEHVGDFEQFWAEGPEGVLLPNSNLRVDVATGYHDWEHGCTNVMKCYWPNVFFGVAAGKLDPDLPAASTFAAYRDGRDEFLDRIHTFLGANH